jgi:hypothetical protein
MTTRATSVLGLAAVAPGESTAEEKTGRPGNDIPMVSSGNGRCYCQSLSVNQADYSLQYPALIYNELRIQPQMMGAFYLSAYVTNVIGHLKTGQRSNPASEDSVRCRECQFEKKIMFGIHYPMYSPLQPSLRRIWVSTL